MLIALDNLSSKTELFKKSNIRNQTRTKCLSTKASTTIAAIDKNNAGNLHCTNPTSLQGAQADLQGQK